MKPHRLLLPLVLAALALGAANDARAADGCTPADAVFYSGDSQNLAIALHANPSPCTNYWISIGPTGAGEPRTGPIALIHSFGPQFHGLAELRPKAWANKLVGGDWFATGVKLHDDMLAAGYDPTRDTWAVNEVGFPSDSPTNTDVYAGNGDARLHFRDFVRGLYEGTSGPPMPGLVFAADPPQLTTNIWDYEQGLARWYGDTAFWQDMQAHVRFWAQETYADARATGVAGSSLDERAAALNDYYLHGLRLATGAAAAFFANAYVPLGNAAYRWPAPPDGGVGFGMTDLPIGDMLSFVGTQAYALRTSTPSRFGFAIAALNSTAALNAQIYSRLAAAIHDADPCAAGCDFTVAGAAFPQTWSAFATPPLVVPHVDGPLGANGWYTGDVTISWDAVDPQTGLWSSEGCDTVPVTEDTAGATFTCTATSSGGTASASVTVKRDATAPTLTCSPSTATLWPPNHKLVPVEIEIGVADATAGPAGPAEQSVTELIRADKDAVYTLLYGASDQAGNGGTCTVTIAVPHDQGH